MLTWRDRVANDFWSYVTIILFKIVIYLGPITPFKINCTKKK